MMICMSLKKEHSNTIKRHDDALKPHIKKYDYDKFKEEAADIFKPYVEPDDAEADPGTGTPGAKTGGAKTGGDICILAVGAIITITKKYCVVIIIIALFFVYVQQSVENQKYVCEVCRKSSHACVCCEYERFEMGALA